MKKIPLSIVSAFVSIALSACNGTPTLTGVPTSTSSSSSCTSTVVDYGLKGIVAGTQRGLYSDTRVNPVTGYPALAYSDAATGPAGNMTVMFSYWNGSRYIHETVAGDAGNTVAGGAQMIRLAFLSTGRPLLFWTTNSTTVKMAVRSVALSSTDAATWSMAVIDTLAGATTGAIEVAVNPIDQVAIVYGHTRAATQRPRSILCSSSCENPSNYVTMNAATDFIDSASNAVASSVGVAWCKVNSSTWWPAVAYHGGGNFLNYAICQSSNFTTCGVAGNWLKHNAGAGIVASVAGSTAAKLYIDPTVVGDQPKVLGRTAAGAGLVPYLINQNCNSAPTSATTGNAVGASAATTGNAWVQLLKDSNGFFHIVANQTTTSVSYFNTTSAAGFAAATWNNAGTIDTQTQPAQFLTVGGADLNTTNDTLYMSYGGSAAPFNLVQGMVSGLQTASSAGTFSTVYPNMAGSIQSPTGSNFTARNNAIASTSGGRLGVAYVDYSAGGALGVGGKLKFAYRDGTSASSSWEVNVIPGTTNPSFPSLVFDSNNLPWISYYEDAVFGTQRRYYLMTNSREDGTGTWHQYVFPYYAKTTLAAMPAADETALALYYSGGVAYPVMIIANSHTTSTGLRASRLNPTTGKWTPVQLIDALGASGLQRLVADYDTSGNIVAAWYDRTLTRARYAYTTNGGTSWGAAVSITGAGEGQGLGIKLDNSGIPAVSYYVKASNTMNYMKCSLSSASACGNAAAWTTSYQLNPSATSVGVSTLGANADLLLGSDIIFDSSNVATIHYPTGSTSTTSVGLMKAVGTTSFTQSTFYAASNGDTTSNAAANASNFALPWNPSAVLTSRGVTAVSFVGPGNWLYVTSCGD